MTASFYDRQTGEYINCREIIRKRVRNLERAVLDSTEKNIALTADMCYSQTAYVNQSRQATVTYYC